MHLVAFGRALGDRADSLDASLAERLDELMQSALEERNGDPVPAALKDEFLAHLGSQLPAESAPGEWLQKIQFRDAFLAFLASRHDHHSVHRVTDMIATAAARVCGPGDAAQEVSSVVAVHLLVPPQGQFARILSYSARGPLAAWIQMVCKRKAIDLSRKKQPARTDAEELIDSTSAVVDPEIDLLKFRYAKKFNEALETALRELPAADANLLFLTSVKKVPLSSAARMEGVSARTLQRRVARIREDVFDATRRIAREMLGASEAEMSSLLGLVQSQLDVTLHRVLQPEE